MNRVIPVWLLLGAACAHGDVGPARSAPVRLDVIAVNDFHGYLEPPLGGVRWGGEQVPAGGASYLASHVQGLRAAAEHAIVVSAGDLIGASPLISSLFHDEPTIELMNELGLDLNGVGNHEFDEGLDELLRMKGGGCHPVDGCADEGAPFEGARFEFLAANVIDQRRGATIFPPYAIRSFEGLPVAFIGLTLEGTKHDLPPVVPELEFLDEADTTNALVERLRGEGVRAFVLLLHEGGFPESADPNACEGLSGPVVDIVERLHPDVDVVLSGHTHQAYVCDDRPILLTSGGSYGRLVTHVVLELDPVSGDVVSKRAENQVVHHEQPEDPAIAAMVDGYRVRSAPLANRVITRMRGSLVRARTRAGVSSLGRVIADAQLEATRSEGAELALMNGGGIRTAVAPVLGADGLGDVTYGMLFAAQPFGNVLVTMDLTGRQILRALNAQFERERPRFLDPSSNVAYRWRVDAEGRREVVPKSVLVSGRALGLDRPNRVTEHPYKASPGVYTEGSNPVNGPVDLDALVAYLSERDPFEVPSLGGIEVASTP